MARTTDYGTSHVGVRCEGEREWLAPGRGWETFDRVTGSRVGPVHATLRDAVAYADYREGATFGHAAGIPCPIHPAGGPA